MTFFEFLERKLGNSGRCDFYFRGGRVEVHRMNNSSTIFVRIAKEVHPREEFKHFVPIDFSPTREYWINESSENDLEIRNLIKNFQKKISHP